MTPIEKQILMNQCAIMRYLVNTDETGGIKALELFLRKTDVLLDKQESKKETCCEMPEEFAEANKEVKEKSPLDLCANCNHSRFDHTEKDEPIHCSYGGKGCGCTNFVEVSNSEEKK